MSRLLFLIFLAAVVVGQEEEEDVEIEDSDKPKPNGDVSIRRVGRLGPLTSAAAPTQEEIDDAIARGVAWLRKMQMKRGGWKEAKTPWTYKHVRAPTLFPVGPSALALHTLGVAGFRKKDPAIKSGTAWLAAQKPFAGLKETVPSTYEAAAMILAMEAAYPHPDSDHAKRKRHPSTKSPTKVPRRSRMTRQQWLILGKAVEYLGPGTTGGAGGRISHGRQSGCQGRDGGWGYGPRPRTTTVSSTHFVLTGLRAAARAGYPIDPDVWRRAVRFLERVEKPDGSFPYVHGGTPSLRMTLAGTVALLICRERLRLAGANPPRIDQQIERGRKRIEKAFRDREPLGDHPFANHLYYVLWTVEQYGSLTGDRLIGGIDWYAAGARRIIDEQRKSGSWTNFGIEPEPIVGTCFALMFLKRGTPPLWVGKWGRFSHYQGATERNILERV